LEAVPETEVPRVTRGIKKTALPKLDEGPDPLSDLELPGEKPTRIGLPSVTNTPLGKSGWKSKTLEPAGAQVPGGDQFPGPKSESARFERDVDPADLRIDADGTVLGSFISTGIRPRFADTAKASSYAIDPAVFEYLNPANSNWDKYYQVFSNADTEPARFVEAERKSDRFLSGGKEGIE
jgi:hypothetical protein